MYTQAAWHVGSTSEANTPPICRSCSRAGFEFVINLNTALGLELEVPRTCLRGDRMRRRDAIAPRRALLTESTVSTVHPFVSKARFLDPERTRMASEAFDLALELLGETGDTLPSQASDVRRRRAGAAGAGGGRKRRDHRAGKSLDRYRGLNRARSATRQLRRGCLGSERSSLSHGTR